MPQVPFVGPSYNTRSNPWDCQRVINMFLARSEAGNSKSPACFFGTPGFRTFLTLPLNPIRGTYQTIGRSFAVAGNGLFEIFIDGTYQFRGQLGTTTGSVGFSSNGKQVIVVDGPNGYIFNLATQAFTQITAPGFLGSNTVTFIDGYFVCQKPGTQIFFISGLYDGLAWDALDFASAEGSPDAIVAVITLHKELWIFGTSTVQMYYNSGAADFPFAAISGAFIEYGCAAPDTVAKTANSVFWVGQDDDGNGIVWMATSYQPQRISTYAIEQILQQYKGAIQSANGYTYQEAGQYFYVLNLPGANTTLVYSVSEQQWHERRSFNNGVWGRHRGQSHIFAFNQLHLVGDYQSGKVYQQSLDFYDEDGVVIRRERITPHSAGPELERITYNHVQIDMETGVGLSSGAPEDMNPHALLSWSDDGGRTYGNEHRGTVGALGNYRTRSRWRRMGTARDRVYKWAYTGRTKVTVIAGYLDVTDNAA